MPCREHTSKVLRYGTCSQGISQFTCTPGDSEDFQAIVSQVGNQHVRVMWNGVYSNVFSVVNGVKQGGVIALSFSVCIWMSC